ELVKRKETEEILSTRSKLQRELKETITAAETTHKPKRAPRRRRIDDKEEGTRLLQRLRWPLVATLAFAVLAYFFFPTSVLKTWGRPQLQVVRGQAFFRDQPIPKAAVVLDPVWTKEPSFPRPKGVVGDDGSFALSTYGQEDGAPEGEYRVILTLFVVAP